VVKISDVFRGAGPWSRLTSLLNNYKSFALIVTFLSHFALAAVRGHNLDAFEMQLPYFFVEISGHRV